MNNLSFQTTLAFSLLCSQVYASAISQTESPTQQYTPFGVDIEGKLIGRIRFEQAFDPWGPLDFAPWVRAQVVPESNPDEHVCAYEFIGGHPFLDSDEVMQPAQFIAHNCPKKLIKGIYFSTQIPDQQIQRQDMAKTKAPMVKTAEGTQINTWLFEPKMGTGEVSGSFDAWLFPVDHEFDQDTSLWAYAYNVVRSGEDFLAVREAPLWWDEARNELFDLQDFNSSSFSSGKTMIDDKWVKLCGPDNLPQLQSLFSHGGMRLIGLLFSMECEGQSDSAVLSLGNNEVKPYNVVKTGFSDLTQFSMQRKIFKKGSKDLTLTTTLTIDDTDGNEVFARSIDLLQTADSTDAIHEVADVMVPGEFLCGFNWWTGLSSDSTEYLASFAPIFCAWY